MNSSATSRVAAVLLAFGLVAYAGCGSDAKDYGTPGIPMAGAAGAPVTGMSGGGATSAGASGAPISAGAAGMATTGGAAGAAGAPVTAGAAGMGMAGGAATNDITKVVPTSGCSKDPGIAIGMAVKGTIQTMGTKPADAADSKKGPWSYEREYFVTLPTGYDKNKAYPLVLQGPGCGGKGTDVYPLKPDTASANNVNNTVIRVGITPPPNDIGHATNPGQGCFDDKEGDDSVDWVMYENLYDKLAGQLCFDRNRVFASGNSSGAWFSNELGCKYAGDATRPVRGIMPNTGGLPMESQFKPTCTNKPMAGMWVHEVMDGTNAFTGNKFAIARAMTVNGCMGATSYDDATFDDYPIGDGKPANTCKKIKGCPALYPLVVCALAGSGHGSHDEVTNPGFSTFLKMFSAGTFITQ